MLFLQYPALMIAIVIVAQVDAAAEAQQGKALFQQGKVEEAIPHFQRAVELREKDATAWYNLPYAQPTPARSEEAAQSYRRYTQLSPNDPDGYFGLAESLRQSGHGDDARAAYLSYVEKEKRPSEQKWVAVARQQITMLSSAAPAPTAPSAPGPVPAPPKPDPAALIAKGDAAFAAKDFHSALFAYQDATVADPNSLAALVKAGEACARMGHFPEAIGYWNRALKLDPQNATARDGLADAREKQAVLAPLAAPPRHIEAPVAPPARHLEAPVAPPPRQIDEAAAREHYAAGVNLINQKKYPEALAELDRALTANPKFAVAFVARGSADIGMGDYTTAFSDYSAARDADPSLASPLFGLAEAYRGLGQPQKAADLYRQFAASNAPDAQQSLKDYALQNAQALAPK